MLKTPLLEQDVRSVQHQNINNISSVDKAYIAGFCDGEGTIGLRTGHSHDGRTPSYTLRVRISNTNKDILLWIQAVTGCGHIHCCKQIKDYKPKFEIAWSGKIAAEILIQLYPYIRIKKIQAEIGIRFADTITNTGGERLSKEIIIIRDSLRERMDVANDSKNYMSKRGGLGGL